MKKLTDQGDAIIELTATIQNELSNCGLDETTQRVAAATCRTIASGENGKHEDHYVSQLAKFLAEGNSLGAAFSEQLRALIGQAPAADAGQHEPPVKGNGAPCSVPAVEKKVGGKVPKPRQVRKVAAPATTELPHGDHGGNGSVPLPDAKNPSAEDPGNALAVRPIRLVDVKMEEPFDALFMIKPEIRQAIGDEMKKSGADPAHPIVIWKQRGVVIDGHTRILAAGDAGLTELPAAFREFKDADEAVEYAIHCQRNRRNLSDAEIVRLVAELDRRASRGGDHGNQHTKSANAQPCALPHRSSTDTAQKLGISSRKVEQVRTVNDDPEVKAEVEAGKLTVNAGCKKVAKKRRSGKGNTHSEMLKSCRKGLGFLKQAHACISPHLPEIGVLIGDVQAKLAEALKGQVARRVHSTPDQEVQHPSQTNSKEAA